MGLGYGGLRAYWMPSGSEIIRGLVGLVAAALGGLGCQTATVDAMVEDVGLLVEAT